MATTHKASLCDRERPANTNQMTGPHCGGQLLVLAGASSPRRLLEAVSGSKGRSLRCGNIVASATGEGWPLVTSILGEITVGGLQIVHDYRVCSHFADELFLDASLDHDLMYFASICGRHHRFVRTLKA